MAVFSTVRLGDLAPELVIAPERYHPGRLLPVSGGGVKLAELVELHADIVAPVGAAGETAERFLVLDTSDASEGFIRSGKEPVTAKELGSAKKLVRPGDVFISRLRPYLRQVAYCDAELAQSDGTTIRIACSTEFFVLRGTAGEIAFLAAYLLSDGPQRALAASVEGGHHPRFGKQALLELPVPRSLLDAREEISRLVIDAVSHRRESERLMGQAVSASGRRDPEE